jgi:hypothetical protein
MRELEKLETEALEIYLHHIGKSDEKALLERKMTNFMLTEADKPDITTVAKKLGQEVKNMLTRLPKGMNKTRESASKILTDLGKIAMTGNDDKKDVKNAVKLVTDASATMSKFLNATTKIMAPLELVLKKEKVDNITFKDIFTDAKYQALKEKLPEKDAFQTAIKKVWHPPVGFMQGLKNMFFGEEESSFKLTMNDFYEDLMGSTIGELRKFVDPGAAGATMKIFTAAPAAVTAAGGADAAGGAEGSSGGGSSNKFSDYDFNKLSKKPDENLINFAKYLGSKDVKTDAQGLMAANETNNSKDAIEKLKITQRGVNALKKFKNLKLEGTKRDESSLILERWSKLAGLDE